MSSACIDLSFIQWPLHIYIYINFASHITEYCHANKATTQTRHTCYKHLYVNLSFWTCIIYKRKKMAFQSARWKLTEFNFLATCVIHWAGLNREVWFYRDGGCVWIVRIDTWLKKESGFELSDGTLSWTKLWRDETRRFECRTNRIVKMRRSIKLGWHFGLDKSWQDRVWNMKPS